MGNDLMAALAEQPDPIRGTQCLVGKVTDTDLREQVLEVLRAEGYSNGQKRAVLETVGITASEQQVRRHYNRDCQGCEQWRS